MKPLLILLSLTLAGCASSAKVHYVTEPDFNKAAELNADLGLQYLRIGDLDNARVKLESAIKQDPSNVDANHGYALLQARTGQPKEAETHLKKALRLSDQAPDIRNSYAVFLCAQGRLEQAYQQFDRTVKDSRYRTPEFALDNAGQCAMKQGQLPVAQDYLLKALAANPRFAPAKLHLAQLLDQQKRPHLALDYLGQFHEASAQTAESLWLAIRLNQRLGQRDELQRYGQLLTQSFPDSAQAKHYLRQHP